MRYLLKIGLLVGLTMFFNIFPVLGSVHLTSNDTLDRLHIYFNTYGIVKYYGAKKPQPLEARFKRDIHEILTLDLVDYKNLLKDLVSNVNPKDTTLPIINNHCLSINEDYFQSVLLDFETKVKISHLLASGANRAYKKSNKWRVPKKWKNNQKELEIENCLLGICDLWNIIRFYYPYRDLLNLGNTREFDNIILQFYRSNKPISKRYYKALLEVASLINDNHTLLRLNNSYNLETLVLGNGYPRIGVTMNYGVMTISSLHGAVEKKYGLSIGDTITQINGLDPKTDMTRFNYLLSAEHEGDKESHYATHYALRGWYDEIKSLHVKVNSTKMVVNLPCLTTINSSISVGNKHPVRHFQQINDSTVYVQPFLDRKDFKRLKEANFENMILDCRIYPNMRSWKIINRLNPAEKHMYSIGNVRTPCKTRFMKVRYRYIYFSRFVKNFETKTYVLQDEETISFGESVLLALRYAGTKRTTFFGSNSSGTFGGVNYFQLPGDVLFQMTVERQQSVDGKVYQYLGLSPDFVIDLDYWSPEAIWDVLSTIDADK